MPRKSVAFLPASDAVTAPIAPRSLRAMLAGEQEQARLAGRKASRDLGALGLGVITAACLGVSSPVLAQTSGAQLPTLTVEASAEARKAKPAKMKQATRKPAARKPVVAASPAQPSSAQPAAASAPSAAAHQPGANPYANPNSAYKVERSANSRLPQPLLDTPRTVLAIPKEVLEAKGATSFRDVARTTPGVTLGTGEGGNAFGDRIFIRGFDARNDVYIDGIRDSGVTSRENFAVEQMEVIKGPAGSVAGRGTTGGAVNVVQKKPEFANFGSLSSTVGTDSTRRMTVDLNRVITPELAVRVNGMGQLAGVAGRDHVYDDRWGGLVGATYKPNETFKFTVDYMHLTMDGMADWGVPFNGTTKLPWTESGLNRSNFYGQVNRDFQRGSQDVATATAEIRLNDTTTLTNKTRFGQSVNDYIASAPERTTTTAADPALWTVSASAKSRYQTNTTVANQLEYATKLDLLGAGHTFNYGVEASRERVWRDSYRGLATETYNVVNLSAAVLNMWNPDSTPMGAPAALVLSGNWTEVNVISKSAFLLDTVKLNEQWQITGGVRLDTYDLTSDANSAGTITRISRSDVLFNWNAGITYKPIPITSIYLAFGTSSNPIGAELDAGGADYGGITASTAILAPERNASLELGNKWELFNKRLLVSGALFQTTKENARESSGSGSSAVWADSGAYVIRGLDISAGGNITDRWRVHGGMVLMQSEVTRSINAANVGLKLANIAHESFNLLTNYDVTDKLTLGAQATWKGKIYGGTLVANSNVLPAGWRFDLMADYKVTDKATARFKVLNVTNEVIYDAFYRSGTPFVYLSPGRAAYLTIDYKL